MSHYHVFFIRYLWITKAYLVRRGQCCATRVQPQTESTASSTFTRCCGAGTLTLPGQSWLQRPGTVFAPRPDTSWHRTKRRPDRCQLKTIKHAVRRTSSLKKKVFMHYHNDYALPQSTCEIWNEFYITSTKLVPIPVISFYKKHYMKLA